MLLSPRAPSAGPYALWNPRCGHTLGISDNRHGFSEVIARYQKAGLHGLRVKVADTTDLANFAQGITCKICLPKEVRS